jgi:hypothetical protein
MAIGAILYLWSHPIFARMHQKRKRYPKFAYMQWNLPRCAIIIGSTIKIRSACMHIRMLSSGRAGFLCYPCELFTLFMWTIYAIHSKKENKQFMACVPRERLVVGPGVWLTHVAEVDVVHGWGDTPDSLEWGAGGRAGAVQPSRGWSARASSNIWKPRAIYIHTHLYPLRV